MWDKWPETPLLKLSMWDHFVIAVTFLWCAPYISANCLFPIKCSFLASYLFSFGCPCIRGLFFCLFEGAMWGKHQFSCFTPQKNLNICTFYCSLRAPLECFVMPNPSNHIIVGGVSTFQTSNFNRCWQSKTKMFPNALLPSIFDSAMSPH